jgi:hypothetical protein
MATRKVCNETKHQPGLVFMCDNNSGGIDNIRNYILTCVRYAFDAGATGIILPKIQRRLVADLANTFTTSLQPFDYFFDEQHFRYALGTHCPRLAIKKYNGRYPKLAEQDGSLLEMRIRRSWGDLASGGVIKCPCTNTRGLDSRLGCSVQNFLN